MRKSGVVRAAAEKLAPEMREAAPSPLTITRPALLVDGSDQRFRELIVNLMTMSNQLQELRAGLARRLGVSEPEYRVFLAVAQLQAATGIRVGGVARHLEVTGALVTMIANRLVRLGWIEKMRSSSDSRQVLLRLTPRGTDIMTRFQSAPQTVNDELFRDLTAAEFRLFGDIVQRIVAGGARALAAAAAEAVATEQSSQSSRAASG
jgi:DNA-binding MarR family transcriptional regulator